jgi:hypothetical protein
LASLRRRSDATANCFAVVASTALMNKRPNQPVPKYFGLNEARQTIVVASLLV